MKTVTVIGCTTLLFFAVGIGTVLMTPSLAQAGPDGCTSFCGTKELCGGVENCNPVTERMHYVCKQWDPPLIECDGPWTCGCRAVGCGDLCIGQ
ncbi:MAG: hypothetical protein OEV49_02215 [candidate division Zixibacteria bacterium]|nr:hypothetical protein [candidate division Zixibacteria bacterium]MDH3936800.1 hypothetical protein [candidate division Zixibacteria bacterium]MDH4033215.1 hypothetical protein [candidate division Zixibacteria bacterium]